jgi:hypothetical protein
MLILLCAAVRRAGEEGQGAVRGREVRIRRRKHSRPLVHAMFSDARAGRRQGRRCRRRRGRRVNVLVPHAPPQISCRAPAGLFRSPSCLSLSHDRGAARPRRCNPRDALPASADRTAPAHISACPPVCVLVDLATTRNALARTPPVPAVVLFCRGVVPLQCGGEVVRQRARAQPPTGAVVMTSPNGSGSVPLLSCLRTSLPLSSSLRTHHVRHALRRRRGASLRRWRELVLIAGTLAGRPRRPARGLDVVREIVRAQTANTRSRC